MFFTSYKLQVAANYSNKRQFLQEYLRYAVPISAVGTVMGNNRDRLLDMFLALVIAEFH